MNRFANTGEIEEPCGVPRSRATSVPSCRCSGATSHRCTYSRIHFWSVCRATALSRSVWSTLSKESPTYCPHRGPRSGVAGARERVVLRAGGRRVADRAPAVAVPRRLRGLVRAAGRRLGRRRPRGGLVAGGGAGAGGRPSAVLG